LLIFGVLFLREKKGAVPADVPAAPAQTVKETVKPAEKTEDEKRDASFDVVRVETDGTVVAAGRAANGQKLDLMDGKKVLTQIEADENGEWVFLSSAALPSGDHELWLRPDKDATRETSETVFVSVPEKPADTMIVMLTPEAPEVLQKPDGDADVTFSVETARYADGVFFVSGNADADGEVYVYLNNVLVGKTRVGDGMTFRLSKKTPVNAGTKYVLRADRLDAAGKVAARAEVPFSVAKGVDPSVKIVKGDNLWTIARQIYGSGFEYVTIYRANKNQIKNPDLIYPEQVFVLPVKPAK
jgi:nucleoid-associated protein YgaU